MILRALLHPCAATDSAGGCASSPMAAAPAVVAGVSAVVMEEAAAMGAAAAWRHLEIFTRATIEAILSVSGLGRAASVGGTRRREPTATEGGDPSGTYKRWFGRVSRRAGWWRGSSLVRTSYWPGCH